MQTAHSQHILDKMLLRPQEVAEALGLGRSTVYELMRSGELPVIHIGRAARIPTRAVEAWIEQRAKAEESRRGLAH